MDPMEATFIGVRMWVKQLPKQGPIDVDAVRQAMYGQRIKAPSGFEVVMNTNHHLSKPVMIGKINSFGTLDVIWQSINPVRADAWSKYIPDSATRTADWTFPWVCGGCIRADIQGMVTVRLWRSGPLPLRSRVYAVLSVTRIPAEFKHRISWRPPRRAMHPLQTA